LIDITKSVRKVIWLMRGLSFTQLSFTNSKRYLIYFNFFLILVRNRYSTVHFMMMDNVDSKMIDA